MPRPIVEWRSGSKDNYNDFCKKHPTTILSYQQWRKIVYGFNESFREYILETGERGKLPFGIGEFSIIKKKRKRIKVKEGKEYMNLPIDWKKTKEKGKRIYNFNFHTEGYFFGWIWFKYTSRIVQADLWYFKPCRLTSRLLSYYLKTNDRYQHLYCEWPH